MRNTCRLQSTMHRCRTRMMLSMVEEALAYSSNGHLSINHFTRRDLHDGDEAILSFFSCPSLVFFPLLFNFYWKLLSILCPRVPLPIHADD